MAALETNTGISAAPLAKPFTGRAWRPCFVACSTELNRVFFFYRVLCVCVRRALQQVPSRPTPPKDVLSSLKWRAPEGRIPVRWNIIFDSVDILPGFTEFYVALISLFSWGERGVGLGVWGLGFLGFFAGFFYGWLWVLSLIRLKWPSWGFVYQLLGVRLRAVDSWLLFRCWRFLYADFTWSYSNNMRSYSVQLEGVLSIDL